MSDNFEEEEDIVFPSGEYYIGDPCYVLSDEMWDYWCYNLHMKKGEVWINGEKVAIYSTHCGDGEFIGNNGFTYHVDSGCFGMVPSSLFDQTMRQRAEKLGTFHHFAVDVTFMVLKTNKFTRFIYIGGSDETDSDDVELYIDTY